MPGNPPITERRWNVLISAPCFLPVLEQYRSKLEERGVNIIATDNPESLSEEDLLPLVTDIDGVICGDDCFTERVLKAASKLKVISKWGTGIDSIDTATCERLGIVVKRSPGAFSYPVADTTMGLILCFARMIPWTDKEMKRGGWPKTPGRALNECTLGIIGTGDIGRAVARRAKAHGMKLLGYDIVSPPDSFIKETDIKMTNKEELLKASDFVSLHLALTKETRRIIATDDIALMKPSAIIINTARGPLIEENALIEALQTKRIAGAGLDVFEVEPLSAKSVLRNMENVILSSHNANQSPMAMAKVHENTISNLLEVLEKRGTLT